MTARLPVTDLEELFGVSIDAEDVETVGGLLAYALGRVPIAGSTAAVSGLTLTAESLEGRRNRIGTVTVEGKRAGSEGRAARRDSRRTAASRFSPAIPVRVVPSLVSHSRQTGRRESPGMCGRCGLESAP